jgi:hypothetical protein
MDRHNIVVVYSSRGDAERAMEELIKFGIPAQDIRLSASNTELSGNILDNRRTEDFSAERHQSFWDWLFGNDVPEYDRNWYRTNLSEGRTGLSVLLHNQADRERVADILERFHPIDIDDEPAGLGSMAEQRITASHDVNRDVAGTAGMRTGAPEMAREAEQVIPVVKEEIAVGKRAAERRYRIRTYVVETPVEEQVRLRDERVIVEHRPASGTVAGNADALREREFEVVERHEEPVIEKHVRPVEEVVVRREANERVETVRDTVRETKVDVDKEAAVHQTGREPPAKP